jgi:hypothetical protein
MLVISILVVGCRSSRSGTSHSELDTNTIVEAGSDSVDFRKKFAHYLSQQESNLKLRIIEYYPGDTANHGAVKSMTEIDLSHKTNSDSIIKEQQVTVISDTASINNKTRIAEENIYKIKQHSWYEPFIPYLGLALLGYFIYRIRRKK